MRYANSQHSHQGVGVVAQGGTLAGETSILIIDGEDRREVRVLDKAQLQEFINLLRDASILCGWGAVK
jgi:hypothetical protein